MKYNTLLRSLTLASGLFSVTHAGILQHLSLTAKQDFLGTLDEIPGGSPIALCDTEEDQLLNIEYIKIDPKLPTRGANLTISAAGTLSKDIVEGAYVIVDVRYGYVRLLKQTIDLCEEIENVDMECPLEAGYQKLTKQIELPNEIPPGKYFVEARAYDIEDELITCLKASVEFPVDF